MGHDVTALFASADAEPAPPVWREAEQTWVLTRHADVRTLLRTADAEVVEFQSRIAAIGQRAGRDYGCLVGLLAGILFFRNPPWHTQARASLRRSLGAIGARMTEAEIAPIVENAVACLAGRGPGPVDAVAQLADRIPVLVMAHILGLSEATVDTLHRQGKGVVSAWHRAMPLRVYDALQRQAADIHAALRREIDRARSEGGPLRAFCSGGDAFDDGEIVGMLFGIIMAGIETTAGLLASVLYAIAAGLPDAATSRGGSIAERGFVEEVLRLAPPVRKPSVRRLATRQRFGEVVLEAGSLVGIDIKTAQRDSAVYDDPHTFNPGRVGPPLLAFGNGIHACLGGHLATLEARLLMRMALRVDLGLAQNGGIDWDPDPTFCRLRRLDLRVDPLPDRNRHLSC